jgi:hypothetical protein
VSCERCDGTGFVIVEHNGVEGAKMCVCRAKAQQPAGRPLREDMAAVLVEALCQNLAFAPDAVGQGLVVTALMEMCSTEDQAKFVVSRACSLHTKWETCGIRGLRQILCSRFVPKDGLSLSSTEAYPDGIPATRPPELLKPRLTPGRAVSADLDCERAAPPLVETKAIVGRPKPASAIPINANFRPFTAADIERERERLRQTKAQEKNP